MLSLRWGALSGVSLITLSLSQLSAAQTAPVVPAAAGADSIAPDDDVPEEAEAIVVQGNIGYRNRSEGAESVLVYGTDYFQRFEPLTAGDALKRVPSVTFLSDVIESDGARLRGLDPGYTQILINGERVPGSNADRSFFLDRIPAELIDRVEIVRSNSARRPADAIAGTLNIVLRDAFELNGGYVKAGGLLFDDGEVKPNFGAVWGGEVGGGRLLLGGNVQGRYNPKQKSSFRYGNSPENEPDYETEEFDNREDQEDTRDGTDYSFNGSYGIDLGATKLEFDGYYVRTDREERERSREYDDPAAVSGPVPTGGNLLTDADQFEKIDQENYALAAKGSQQWSLGTTALKVGFSRFREDIVSTELEIDFDTDADPAEFGGERTRRDIRDSEFFAALDHTVPVAAGIDLVVGGYLQNKRRDTDISAAEDEFELSAGDVGGYDPAGEGPAGFTATFDEFEVVTGGLSKIKEDRRDAFALVEGKTGIATWEAGLRYETTDVRIDDLEEEERFDNDYSLLLPSASMKLEVSARDRVTASVARTTRRPRFDYISPALLEGELGENDLVGNPELEPETAWGVDFGYERRIGATGVAGVNVFHRWVSNLVEIANTGEEGSEGEGTFILQPRNSGDGRAWGIEFDLSASLGMFGLSDTGVFGNLALLDSKVEDFMGKRRFNGQPKYVYNLGVIQNLPGAGAAFGVTYRKQGSARDRLVGEEVRTTYGGELELFVEKRLFGNVTIRAVGSNLLDSKKREFFNKFDTIEDQLDRDFDEYEVESEKSGPVFQLVGRLAF